MGRGVIMVISGNLTSHSSILVHPTLFSFLFFTSSLLENRFPHCRENSKTNSFTRLFVVLAFHKVKEKKVMKGAVSPDLDERVDN